MDPIGVLGYSDKIGYLCYWCLDCFIVYRQRIEDQFPKRGKNQGTWDVYSDQIGPYRLKCRNVCPNVYNDHSRAGDFLDENTVNYPPAQLFGEENE